MKNEYGGEGINGRTSLTKEGENEEENEGERRVGRGNSSKETGKNKEVVEGVKEIWKRKHGKNR